MKIFDEDAQPIIDAISMIKGVLKVTPNVADSNESIARLRVTVEVQQALMVVAQTLGKKPL